MMQTNGEVLLTFELNQALLFFCFRQETLHVVLAGFASMRMRPRINNVRLDWIYNWSDVTFSYNVVL